MRKLVMVCVVVSLGVLGCGKAPEVATTAPAPEVNAAAEQVAAAEPAAVEARHDVVYVCACGPDCTCGTVKTAPGTCTCGKELVWAHVVKVEGSDALLCQCAEGCTCAFDAADPTRCACGKELRRISLAGTGLYFCNCGGSCTCNHVSAEPGTCGCGMELTSA